MSYTVPSSIEADFLREVPNNPPSEGFHPPTWDQFQAIIRRPKPQKAVGLDNLNLYLVSVLPELFQHWFFFLVKRVMYLDIPQSWLEAEIFLLPKGGDPTNPSNYRPIALLTSLYKVVGTHTSNYLNDHIAKQGTLSDSQFGFRRKYQTTDHSIALASKRTLHPTSYAMYLDLAKAFNSVVLNTLFRLLAKAGFPPEFINMVKRLYRAPLDTPRVNGYRTASHLQLRGLRQGCPLSPSLFSLYIDPLLRILEHSIRSDPTASLGPFSRH